MSNEPETLTEEQRTGANPEPSPVADPPAEEIGAPETEPEIDAPENADAPEEAAETGDIPEDSVISNLFRRRRLLKKPVPATPVPEEEDEIYEEEEEADEVPETPDVPDEAPIRAFPLGIVLLCAALAASIACFLLLGGATLVDRATRTMRYSGDNTVFTFDAHSSNSYGSLHNGLAVASESGLLCLDERGEEVALIQNHNDSPALLQNGTTALSYGIGGSILTAAHYRNGETLNYTVPGTLLDADLSNGSYICIASIQSGYKTVLTALNRKGEELYSWFSSTQFFSQCAVSDKATHIAGIAIGQKGSSFETSCVIFSTDSDTPDAEVPLGSDLIYELRFVSNRRLCAVGETALHYFNLDGSDYKQYSYDSGELLHYSLQGDGFCAIVRDMNEAGGRFRLTTIDNSGKTLDELSLDDEIIDISANGRYLAVLTPTSVQVYDRRLRQCLHSDNIGFATQVCVQADGAVLLIDGATARRIS